MRRENVACETNNPDLNFMDYANSRALQEHVYTAAGSLTPLSTYQPVISCYSAEALH